MSLQFSRAYFCAFSFKRACVLIWCWDLWEISAFYLFPREVNKWYLNPFSGMFWRRSALLGRLIELVDLRTWRLALPLIFACTWTEWGFWNFDAVIVMYWLLMQYCFVHAKLLIWFLDVSRTCKLQCWEVHGPWLVYLSSYKIWYLQLLASCWFLKQCRWYFFADGADFKNEESFYCGVQRFLGGKGEHKYLIRSISEPHIYIQLSHHLSW